MDAQRKDIFHDDWDDSALIDSWNEALAEYKYYHSLQARGEKVECVLHRVEAAEATGNRVIDARKRQLNVDSGDEGELDDEDEEGESMDEDEDEAGEHGEDSYAHADHEKREEYRSGNGRASTTTVNDAPAVPSISSLGAVPQVVLGGGPDEATKNLMMSWYYAGYYTGLYEGQRQATATATTSAAATEHQSNGAERVRSTIEDRGSGIDVCGT